MWCVAPLLHAKVPTAVAFGPSGRLLALVQVEVEVKPAVMIVHPNTALVLKL